MSNYIDLKKEVVGDTTMEIRNNKILKFIQDKGNTLEERWDIYTSAIASGYYINEDTYYFVPDAIAEDSLFEYCGIEKYQSYNYGIFLDDTSELSLEEVTSIKEDILNDGHSSWVFDW